MGAFAVQDPYPKTGDSSVVESDDEEDDCDIGSDVSNADLLELKQELNKLGTENAQRELADATIAVQETTLRRWKRCSEFVRKDHLKLLKSCSIVWFKGYLIWYQKTQPRAQRLNTFETVWKWLRQVYHDICHKATAPDVGKEITNYQHGQFCDERGLIRGTRHKPVIGHNGLYGALYYHWKFNTEILPLELGRVQLAAGLLFLAFTGSRPSAIFGSGCKGIAGTNAALLYQDVKLRLLQPPGETPLLVLEVTETVFRAS